MDLLIDTNVVLDLLLMREPLFAQATRVFELIAEKKAKGYLTVNQTTDIFYLLRRHGKSSTEANAFVQKLLAQMVALDSTLVDAKLALDSGMSDYEDALLTHTALRADLDYILASDLKDFKDSPVAAIGYDEFKQLSS